MNLRTLRCCETGGRAHRVPIAAHTAFLLSALNVAQISSTKVIGANAAAQTSLIATSTLPRIALEYVQICSAASTTCWATVRSNPDTLTLSRACRK